MSNRKTLIANVVQPWKSVNGNLTAPVTLIKQGVMCGSGGCVLYRADLIKQSVEQWDGMPVVVNHPKIDGLYVSAKDTPHEIIGHIRKPYFDSFQNCLRAHVEINTAKPTTGGIMTLKEVSVGVFAETQPEPGYYFNKYYEAVATKIKPDHLAILKNDVGACSWEDGCGIRVNACQCNDPYMKNILIDMLSHAAAKQMNIYKSNQYKPKTSKTMEEVLMHVPLSGKTKDDQEIDVNAWKDVEILPLTDIAFLLNKAKKDNKAGDEGDEILLPTSF